MFRETEVVWFRLVIVYVVCFLGVEAWPSLSPRLSPWDRYRDEIALSAVAIGLFVAAGNTAIRLPYSVFGAMVAASFEGKYVSCRSSVHYMFDPLFEVRVWSLWILGCAFGARGIAMLRGWIDWR